MKSLTSLATLAALLLLPLAARADETPEKQLEFVRKLRAKGYNDLATQYLEMLKQNPPPGLAMLLPLESARTKVSLARERDPGQRLALLAEARQELEKIIQANPNSPQAAQVRFEIARIASLQGNALLTQAFQQEDEAKAEEFARRAEQQYAQAGAELENAVKSLEAALKSLKGGSEQEKALQQQLNEDLLHARFERGRNFLDQAKTYLNTDKADVNLKRAETVDKGRQVLEAVAKEDLDKSPETSYLALAWLIRVAQEAQDPTKAERYFKSVIAAKEPEAATAQRWARYFHMQGIAKDQTLKASGMERLKMIKAAGDDWLARYGAYKNTPEGQGVRFELAGTLFKMAQSAGPKERKLPANVAIYHQAQALLKSLAEVDSDYSHRAAQLNVKISLDLMGADTPTASLKDFEECFLKAQFEMARMQEVSAALRAKADDKLEKERKEHLHNTVEAFRRALAMATPRTPQAKLDEVRFYLTVVYLMSGDPFRAAVQGEALARQEPPSKRSPAAAGYALQAYAGILGRPDENSEANRERLREMSRYILETRAKDWASDPVQSIARYQLAMAYLRDKSHAKAVEQLEKIPPDFSAYIFSQCQLAFAALLARDDTDVAKEKALYEQKAVDALKRVGSLPPTADPATAQMFFAAQLEQGKLLYKAGSLELKAGNLPGAVKKYEEMSAFCKGLMAQFKNLKTSLDEEPRAKLEGAIDALGKYAEFGVADADYRVGNFKKVLEQDTAEVVKAVKAKGAGDAKIPLQDYKLTGDILGLALRANVQTGNVKEAEGLLRLMLRLSGPDGGVSDPTAVLRSLLGELQVQIKEMRAKGDQEKLKKTVETFSKFIDVLAKQGGGKGLDRNDMLFMASCYSSLDQHEKAAELYAKYPEPKFEPTKVKQEGYLDEFKKDTQLYWLVQVFEAQELRKAKKLPEARKLLDRILNGERNEVNVALKAKAFGPKEKDAEKEAAPLLAAGRLLADKEQIHVLEDQEVYGKAVTEWGKFLQGPIKGQLQNNKMKELYFESYYHYAACWYKYSQSPKVKGTPKEKGFLERAANYIIGLEFAKDPTGWQIAEPYFRELLRTEPTLEAVYTPLRQQAEEDRKKKQSMK